MPAEGQLRIERRRKDRERESRTEQATKANVEADKDKYKKDEKQRHGDYSNNGRKGKRDKRRDTSKKDMNGTLMHTSAT